MNSIASSRVWDLVEVPNVVRAISYPQEGEKLASFNMNGRPNEFLKPKQIH